MQGDDAQQQRIIDSILDRKYKADKENAITIRIPYGLSPKNIAFLVSWLVETYPENVTCFSPRKGKYVPVRPTNIVDNRNVFKIQMGPRE